MKYVVNMYDLWKHTSRMVHTLDLEFVQYISIGKINHKYEYSRVIK